MRKSKFLQSSKDMLHRSFKPDKCKTSLRLVTARLKLMKNKKEVQVKQLRREVAQLLESGQDPTARIKVEHVVREEKMMAAYELISLYSELVMTRLPIIESQKNCPIDLKEAITSLIFASPRCGDITELVDVQKQFTAKYGKEFVAAAIELRPDCGVSRMLVEKLAAKAPDGQAKLKILTAIAEEHGIKWDPKPFGDELTAPTDLLNGPASFHAAAEHIQSPLQEPPQTPQTSQAAAVHAQSPRHEPSQVSQNQAQYQSLKPEQNDRFSQGTKNDDSSYSEGGPTSSYSQNEAKHSATERRPTTSQLGSDDRNAFSSHGQNWNMDFRDAASAAQSAAESAERATMAARAAAEFASRDSMKKTTYAEPHQSGPHSRRGSSEFEGEIKKYSSNSYDSDGHHRSDSDQLPSVNFKNPGGTPEISKHGGSDRMKDNRRHSLRSNESQYDGSYDHSSPEAGKYTQKSMHKEEAGKKDSIAKPEYNESEYRRDVHESSNYEYRMENNSRRHSLRSNDSQYDASYDHSSLDAGKYTQKSMYKEEAAKPDTITKAEYNESEYRRNVPESFNSEDFHHIQAVNSQTNMYYEHAAEHNKSEKPHFDEPEYLNDHHEVSKFDIFHDIQAVNSVKKNDTASSLRPSIYDESNDPFDNDHQSFKSHSGADSHFGIEQGKIHTDTSRTGSGNSTFAGFDEAASDHEDISFDTGPKYDDQDSDSDSMPSRKEAPSNIFRIPSDYEFGLDGSKSPEKSVFQQSRSPGKHSSHEFPVISETSVDDFKFDDQFPTKFDGSEDSSNESSHTSRIYLEPPPGNKGQFFPSPDESDDEIPTQSSSELSSKLNFGNLTGGLRQKRYALPSYRSTQVDDASSPLKPTAEKSSSKISTQSRVNTEVKQNKNSRQNTRSSHDDSDMGSSEDERPAQGSVFGRKSYTQSQVEDTEANSRSKVSDPYVESDSDEVPQRSKQTSFGRNNMLSGLSRRTKATPASPARTSKIQPNLGEPKSSDFTSGRKSAYSSYGSRSNDAPESRWTKDTPSSPRTPDFQPKREESDDSDFSSDGSSFKKEPQPGRTIPKAQPELKGTDNSDFSTGRKSTLTSYGSHFTEETESPKKNSGPSRHSEISRPSRKSSEQIPESKVSSRQESLKSTVAEQSKSTLSSYGSHFTEKTESPKKSSGPSRNSETSRPSRKSSEQIPESKVSSHQESLKSTTAEQSKSTLSSYGSHFTEKTESPKKSSGPSRNSEISRPTRKSSEQILESKGSLRQESLKSTAAEQSGISKQKEEAPGTTKTSQASKLTGNAPSSVDINKKPSHVHPKLPDYDNFAAFFKKQ